jgi:hypothetical protein
MPPRPALRETRSRPGSFVLCEHQGPHYKPLRLTDVHELFLAMKDDA